MLHAESPISAAIFWIVAQDTVQALKNKIPTTTATALPPVRCVRCKMKVFGWKRGKLTNSQCPCCCRRLACQMVLIVNEQECESDVNETSPKCYSEDRIGGCAYHNTSGRPFYQKKNFYNWVGERTDERTVERTNGALNNRVWIKSLIRNTRIVFESTDETNWHTHTQLNERHPLHT